MVKNVTLGEIEVKTVSFSERGNEGRCRYIVGTDGMDYCDFLRTYNGGEVQHKRATGVELDGFGKAFFMVYVEDCFDPPVAIVRADNAQDAEEAFVDALPWAHISEPDLKDYSEDDDSLSYGPSGQPYDSSSVMIREVRLVAIEGV